MGKKLGAFEKVKSIASDAGFKLAAEAFDDGSGYQLRNAKSGKLVDNFPTLADVLEYLEASEARSP